MAYKIRVVLDVEKDVIRDILVNETINLEDLHYIVAKSFGFQGLEMASFYKTNEDWEQGEEIPLFDMSEDGTALCMHNCLLKDVLKKEGDNLIYVYDFLSMWTFFVELSKIMDTKEKDLPKIMLSIGTKPDKAPEKEFTAEEEDFDGLNELDDDDFENPDEFDYDNY
ncbi:MAG: IS1096 element passenger TnpR family protein [Lutibacter sp.]